MQPEAKPRVDIAEHLDTWLDEVTRPCGYLVLSVPTGIDLEPTLDHWCAILEEDGETIVRLRVAGDDGEDRPEALRERLAAAIEARFPDFRDPLAHPSQRLADLLRRLAAEHLAPPSRRLLLVIDGLGELRGRDPDDNPLPRLLPHVLPRGVFVVATIDASSPWRRWLDRLAEVEAIEVSGAPEALHAWAQALGAEVQPTSLEALVQAQVARHLADGDDSPALRLLALLTAAGEPLTEADLDLALGDSSAAPRAALGALVASEGGRYALARGRRDPVQRALGPALRLAAERRLAATLASWPCPNGHPNTGYARRHALRHRIGAGAWGELAALTFDLDLLAGTIADAGLGHLVADLAEAAARADESALRGRVTAIAAALEDAAPGLAASPGALAVLLHDGLLDRGWSTDALAEAFGGRLPILRRRLPRVHRDRARTVLRGHDGPILALALAADERTLASASTDGTLKLWDLPRERERLTLSGHSGPVNAVAFVDDARLISGSDDGALILWDADTGCQLTTFVGHAAGVEDLALSADGSLLASVAADGTLILWDLDSGAELASVQAHEIGATAVAMSADGRRIFTGSHDRTIRAFTWSSPTLTPGATFEGPEYAVSGLALDARGERLVVSAYDNRVRVWDLASGELVHDLWGHGSWVTSCVADRGGARALSTSRDRSARLWDLAEGVELCALRGHAKMINCAVLGADGLVLTGGADRTIRRWRLPDADAPPPVEGHEGAVRALLIAGDGSLFSAGADGTLRRWDRLGGEERTAYYGHNHGVMGLALSPDGQTLYSAGSDRTLRAWHVGRGLVEKTMSGHGNWVSACALSPDGALLASTSNDRSVRLWDPIEGRELRVLAGHTKEALCCAFDPQGRLFTGGADAMIRVWDPASGRELMTLAGHEGPILALAIDVEGKHLLSASGDGTIKLWLLRRGRERASLHGHAGAVVGVGWIDGDRLLSAGEDRSLRLWSLASAATIAESRGEHPFTSLAVSPAGDPFGADALAGDQEGNLWLVALRGALPRVSG